MVLSGPSAYRETDRQDGGLWTGQGLVRHQVIGVGYIVNNYRLHDLLDNWTLKYQYLCIFIREEGGGEIIIFYSYFVVIK